jgi:predicted transcriptional regulator
MNSKQKICAIAAGVMAVSNVMPAGVLGADYSEELQEAYKWAYKNSVTTMNTIDQANMYGNLTRIAMAKMLANYAINNLGKKPNSSIDCTFRDVTSAMDKAYDNGVTNACQLGIM